MFSHHLDTRRNFLSRKLEKISINYPDAWWNFLHNPDAWWNFLSRNLEEFPPQQSKHQEEFPPTMQTLGGISFNNPDTRCNFLPSSTGRHLMELPPIPGWHLEDFPPRIQILMQFPSDYLDSWPNFLQWSTEQTIKACHHSSRQWLDRCSSDTCQCSISPSLNYQNQSPP